MSVPSGVVILGFGQPMDGNTQAIREGLTARI
jgi:hypothetical protein